MSQTLAQPAVSIEVPREIPVPERAVPELIIDAHRSTQQYWRDLWAYRELIYFMAWRDILVRYKQTVIGVAWAVIRPLLTMAVGTFVFERVLHLEGIAGVPYPIMIYAAILPWQFFADGMGTISNSLVGNANIVSKIYFPRLIMPVSKVIVSLVDFMVSLTVLAVLIAIYRFVPSWHIVYLPLFTLMAAAVVMGLGQWFAALNVKYRDVMYIVPFLTTFGLYITPVFFSSERVFASGLPEWAKMIYSLNPMVGVVDGFRWCLLGDVAKVYMPGMVASLAVVAVLLVTGNVYFRRTEVTFADYI